ncbi:tail fiber protein [Caulobacter phage BL198]|uniref:Tail fiber protein n=1 Tax=Caulobacter phage BL198 TaxID=3020395 RepID=A0AAE9WYB4_9CAUD|nr:tail fiber protein [Caulobacter phage BL198]
MADNPMLDPSISYSTNRFTSNGSQTTFELSFAGGYISQSNVKAYYVNDLDQVVVVALTFVGANTVSISSPVPSGKVLVVYRDTPKDAPLVDFVDGAIINEKNLDKLAKQAILATGEMIDRFKETIFEGDAVQAIAEGAVATAEDAADEAAFASADAAAALAASAQAVLTANNASASATNTASQFAALVATVTSITGADYSGFVTATNTLTIGGTKTFANAVTIGTVANTRIVLNTNGTYTINGTTRAFNAWGDLTGVPSTFPPSTHTHSQSDITGLGTALSNLTTSVNGKVADGDSLKGDRQTIVTPTITAGVLTLNLALGSVFDVAWDANITSVVVQNAPTGMANWTLILKAIASGGTSVTWNASVFKFVNGVAPTLISTVGAQNFLSMCTRNQGSRVDVFFSGATP